jgi:hypothetical protein
MKSVLKTWSFILILTLASSCARYYDVYGPSKGKHLSLYANISEDHVQVPISIKEGSHFDLFGSASKSSLSEEVHYLISGIVQKQKETGEFEIADGQLLLLVGNSTSNLIGRFDGQGIKMGRDFELRGTVEIKSGTGLFEAKGGNLQLSVYGSLPESQNKRMSYELDIYGYLDHDVPLQ